jgi:hypothetical protein
MQIGDGSMAEWRSLSLRSTPDCTKEPMSFGIDICDWGSVADPLSVIATSSVSGFAYTGTYTGIIPAPPSESTTIENYIYYNDGTSDILYSLSNPDIDAATAATQRIRVLGQSGE